MTLAQHALALWPDEPVAPEDLHALAFMRAAGFTPDPIQERIATTPGNQLVLAHRQRGKSLIAASIGLEDMVQVPGCLDLLVSRSMRQSGELFRKVKQFYTRTQPLGLVKDTEHEMEFSNGSRIISLPASPDTIVGYSGVYRLIIDEAARVPDETYYAVRPMLARSGGSILAITSPFGRRGWFHAAWDGTTDDDHAMDLATVERLLADLDFPTTPATELGEYSDAAVSGVVDRTDDHLYTWTKTFAPVTVHPRLSRQYIAHERRSIPDLWFRQEWLCEFVELGNAVFRYEDLLGMVSQDVEPFFDENGLWRETRYPMVQQRQGFDLGENGWSH